MYTPSSTHRVPVVLDNIENMNLNYCSDQEPAMLGANTKAEQKDDPYP